MPLLGHNYPKVSFEEVSAHVGDLHLEIVGGLAQRGWSVHDVDVIGQKADVPEFVSQLRARGVVHPVHYCGDGVHHSHLRCALYGIKLAFTGRGY